MGASVVAVSRRLSVEQLTAALHRASDARVRGRLLAIRHLVDGHSIAQTVGLFALGRTQLYSWVKRYNAEGLAGLADRPRAGPPHHLSGAQEAAFLARLHAGPPPEAGLSAWRGEDLRRLLHDAFGADYSLSGVYALLHRLNQSNLVPRPQHPNGDPDAQAAFKKPVARRGSRRAGRASQ